MLKNFHFNHYQSIAIHFYALHLTFSARYLVLMKKKEKHVFVAYEVPNLRDGEKLFVAFVNDFLFGSRLL